MLGKEQRPGIGVPRSRWRESHGPNSFVQRDFVLERQPYISVNVMTVDAINAAKAPVDSRINAQPPCVLRTVRLL
ncbi:MAG TPA: hypothetical protein VGD77_06900 [Gemmatimonadaceae bacterium]